jgi:uncharacterized protein (TIGR03000 family)
MNRICLAVFAAALGVLLVGAGAVRAQKTHMPSSHPTPVVRPPVISTPSLKPVLPAGHMPPINALGYNSALTATHLPGYSHSDSALWQQSLWANAALHHRRLEHFHHDHLPASFAFAPWLGDWRYWSPLFQPYSSGVGIPPYYGYTLLPPSVTRYYNALPPVVPASQEIDNSAHVEVVVPDANATVWFGGAPTTSRGTFRYFTSPALQPGTAYTYTIKAAWDEGGQTRTAERVVYVTAGSRVEVDFTQEPPK